MCRKVTVKINFRSFSSVFDSIFLGGKCGICGDAFSSRRDHETGGKYATNLIVREYFQGSSIDVKILVRFSCRKNVVFFFEH